MDIRSREATRDREIARRVRDAGIRRLLEAYEEAGIRGLCGSGRFEVAVDALRDLDLDAVLQECDRSDD